MTVAQSILMMAEKSKAKNNKVCEDTSVAYTDDNDDLTNDDNDDVDNDGDDGDDYDVEHVMNGD